MAEKEFITKLAARTAIENYACRDCVHSNGKKCEDCEYQDCINFINEVEAADVQSVKRGKMIAMSDEEKYRAYKDTARDYDGRCSLCNCCVYDTDIFCAECGAILQDAETTKG